MDLTKGIEELITTLNKCNGSQADAARALGVSRSYIGQLVKKYRIKFGVKEYNSEKK